MSTIPSNPYHAHINVESIRAARSDLKAAAEAIVLAQVAAAETQRMLDKLATELEIQPLLKYIHETLAAH